MPELERKPRIALLGAGPREVELLTELRAAGRVDVAGVYDSDSHALGLDVASVLGLIAAHTVEDLERLRGTDCIILPHDPESLAPAVRWAAGTEAELVTPAAARTRWTHTDPESADVAAPGLATAAGRGLVEAVDWSQRLQDRNELASWLLELALQAVGADGGSIQMLAPDTSELYMVAARGLSERLVRLGRHRVGEGISGTVAATRIASTLSGPKPGRMTRERGAVMASISLPLEYESRLVGVLNVSSTVESRQFGPQHAATLTGLAPRIARLLHEATRLESQPYRLDLPRFARAAPAGDLRIRMRALSEHVRRGFDAERAALFFTTEAGDWIAIASATRNGEAARGGHVRRDLLTRALLDEEWLHARDTSVPPENSTNPDAVTRAVEQALGAAVSVVYAPLAGLVPIGVLVLEFVSLAAAESCVRHGFEPVQQLALYCDAETRAAHATHRMRVLARLARSHPRIVALRDSPQADELLASEAARLVGAHAAIVRRVSETSRTYSRPAVHGLPEPLPEQWRALDARVTEKTLQGRHAVLTTATQESDGVPEAEPARTSRVSVPVVQANELVAVINVYDKEWNDPLDPGAFTEFDREALQSLATVAATLFDAGDSQVAAPPARAVPAAVMPQTNGAAVQTVAAPAAIAAPAGATALLDTVIADTLAKRGGLALWLCRLPGLVPGPGEGPEIRAALASALRSGLRPSDRVAWYDPENLVIVTPGSIPTGVPFEARLLRLLRPQLARLAASSLQPFEVWIGTAAAPEDGTDAATLLNVAIERSG